jgi:hypothetical protein
LADVIGSLTPEQQRPVRQFIEFLNAKESWPASPFLAAVDGSSSRISSPPRVTSDPTVDEVLAVHAYIAHPPRQWPFSDNV